MTKCLTTCLGYPNIGNSHEWVKGVKQFLRGRLPEEELKSIGANIRQMNWLRQQSMGIDLIPSNDFTYCDRMLDMSFLLGNIPKRFGIPDKGPLTLKNYYSLVKNVDKTLDIELLKRKNWFGTRLDYTEPELGEDTRFNIRWEKPFEEFEEAKNLGIITKPVLIGPMSYVTNCRLIDGQTDNLTSVLIEYVDALTPVYIQILKRLNLMGAQWVQMDEPFFLKDVSPGLQSVVNVFYEIIKTQVPNIKILLTIPYGTIGDNLQRLLKIPVDAIHLNVTPHNSRDVDAAIASFPKAKKILSIGIIDGQNIWKNNLDKSFIVLDKAKTVLGLDNIILSTTASLQHVPLTLRNEKELDPEIKEQLSFAEEKLEELIILSKGLKEENIDNRILDNAQLLAKSRMSLKFHNPEVWKTLDNIPEESIKRSSSIEERKVIQKQKYNFPLLPVTTLGTFPLTKEINAINSAFLYDNITVEDYSKFIELEITKNIRYQEDVGIIGIVAGSIEKEDAISFFAQYFKGFSTTTNGKIHTWLDESVQPPILYGDVQRRYSVMKMWMNFALQKTKHIMKAVLVGPYTLYKSSFVREDKSMSEVLNQLGYAIHQEMMDLESMGCQLIQIDETCFIDGVPLKNELLNAYNNAIIRSFKLATMQLKPTTQVHLNLCKGDASKLLKVISEFDADVVYFNVWNYDKNFIKAFSEFKSAADIGIGVPSISNFTPENVDKVNQFIRKFINIIPAQNIWIIPNSDFKYLSWKEVAMILKVILESVKSIRNKQIVNI